MDQSVVVLSESKGEAKRYWVDQKDNLNNILTVMGINQYSATSLLRIAATGPENVEVTCEETLSWF